MKIALDGKAGAGKTTIGKALAKHFHCTFINTGLMYRAVAWALQQGSSLEEIKLHLVEEGRILVNAQHLEEDQLYQRKLDQLASQIARRKEVRAHLIALQRQWAKEDGVVMEGRDIGTVVLPDADVKLYVEASLEERARRRTLQRPGTSFEEILKGLRERDRRDQGFGRLLPAPDALILSTDGKTPEESIAEAIRLIEGSLQRRVA